jgi:hypothetical protein
MHADDDNIRMAKLNYLYKLSALYEVLIIISALVPNDCTLQVQEIMYGLINF